jgi:pimeloyl-ACP methyl ester carboxylesterase
LSEKREVASADGTTIAYRVGGEGRTLMLVHGAATSGADWFGVAPILRQELRVVVLDRRGRGASGDGSEYSMEREAEDLVALAEAEDVEWIVAHSYGALCTIVAANRIGRLRGLVLYEPPIAYDGVGIEHFERLVASGRHDEALHDFLRGVGTSPDQLAAIRDSPAWPVLLDAVPPLPRELRACTSWTNPQGPVSKPTRFLLGGETTADVYLRGLDRLAAAFPSFERVEIPGEQHVAHVFAPQAFADLVLDFVSP